jgi:hypothetical protein
VLRGIRQAQTQAISSELASTSASMQYLKLYMANVLSTGKPISVSPDRNYMRMVTDDPDAAAAAATAKTERQLEAEAK